MLRFTTCACGGKASAWVESDAVSATFSCIECEKTFVADPWAEYVSRTRKVALWPLRSEALAVHPEQRSEAMQVAAKYGVPTDYDSIGRPIFTSAAHRREFCNRVRPGTFCNNAGYSDPVPN